MLSKVQKKAGTDMSMLIICSGKSRSPLEGSYDSAGFDAAVRAAADCAAEAPAERKISPGGRIVYVAEGALAQSSADQLLESCEYRTEPLLNEIPLRSFADTDRWLPAEKWLRKAASQRRAADPRQPESRAAVIARADALIQKLEELGGDSLLITYPLFLTELMDRFRVHGFLVQRSGMIRVQPWEKIVVSRRDEHCGGCQHNCFLSNPGCGVGRDKAIRKSG